jgi:hypothetical protein
VSPHDNTHLVWRIRQAGEEGLVLQGRTAIAHSSVVDLYFPDEAALNEWLTFEVPHALSTLRRESAGPDEAAKSAIRRAAGKLDQTATPSEVADAVVEALKGSGLMLMSAESVQAASNAFSPCVNEAPHHAHPWGDVAGRVHSCPGVPTRRLPPPIPESQARQCPESKPHRSHKWHNTLTTQDHDCPGVKGGNALQSGGLGLTKKIVNTEDDLKFGRWTHPDGRVWLLTTLRSGPPLEDRIGDLWHWTGDYTEDEGWPWPLLDRHDGSVKGLSLKVLQDGLGPLHYTDEVVDG